MTSGNSSSSYSPVVVTSTADLTPDGVGGYAKAIVAGIAAGLTAAGTALTDGTVTLAEGVGIALAVVTAGAGAYWFANKVKPVTVLPQSPITGVVGPPVPHLPEWTEPPPPLTPPPVV